MIHFLALRPVFDPVCGFLNPNDSSNPKKVVLSNGPHRYDPFHSAMARPENTPNPKRPIPARLIIFTNVPPVIGPTKISASFAVRSCALARTIVRLNTSLRLWSQPQCVHRHRAVVSGHGWLPRIRVRRIARVTHLKVVSHISKLCQEATLHPMPSRVFPVFPPGRE